MTAMLPCYRSLVLIGALPEHTTYSIFIYLPRFTVTCNPSALQLVVMDPLVRINCGETSMCIKSANRYHILGRHRLDGLSKFAGASKSSIA